MAKQKAKKITDEMIISLYTDYVLLHGKKPNSVYEFAKKNEFEEVEFYTYFSSFEALEEHYLTEMFDYSLNLISKSKDYENYDASQKLSSFYFTFFEMATANRSFIKYLMESGSFPLKNSKKLKSVRYQFLDFVKNILETPYKTESQKFARIQNRIVNEGAWVQFLTIFKFWMDDKSKGFEKTDIFIEKSIRASFDIVYNVPIESLVDFGKFLWKERTQNSSKDRQNS